MSEQVETYLSKIVDLLFEIRNGIETTNELLEELKNPEPKEKNERPMTRKELREMRDQMERNF